jgi:DNA-binding NarL/FixJ family response regulator
VVLHERLIAAREQCEQTRLHVKRTLDTTRELRAVLQASRGQRSADRAVTERANVERRRAAAGLTGRQHEVLLLVAEGLATKAIAQRLWLSPATVRNHVAAILLTLDAHSRIEALAKARSLGLLNSRSARTGPAG